MRRRYHVACDVAGLERLRFHDLRHTFGSLAINKGSLVQVQHWLRHANIETTARYLHHSAARTRRGCWPARSSHRPWGRGSHGRARMRFRPGRGETRVRRAGGLFPQRWRGFGVVGCEPHRRICGARAGSVGD
jgi:hypothetical protein